MKHKHTVMLILVGWLIAAFLPPQVVLAKIKGK